MKNKSVFFDFSDDDVISFPEYSCMQKVSKFREAEKGIFLDGSNIAQRVKDELNSCRLSIHSTDWFIRGVACEVLRLGNKSWQKGKLRYRVTLEFEPDEPVVEQTAASNQAESELDAIRRQMVNQ